MSLPQLDPLANSNAEAALTRARDGGSADPVLIAGGGIGGLSTALALARSGIASHVIERRPVFHEEGAGIQLGPNGTRILQQLGVADALRARVGEPESLSVRDGASGAELARMPLGEWIAARHGAPYWVAHRKDLHAVLADAARANPLISLSLGFSASQVASNDARVCVANDAGEAHFGSALIAADGVWSGLRTKLIDDSKPRFSGKSAVRSVIAREELPTDFLRNEVTIWLFPQAHVVHYPVSGGRELAIIVVLDDSRHDTDWSAPVAPDWVAQNMPDSAAPLQALIRCAPAWKRWSLQSLPVPAEWTRGRIALLGDAAHPVMPFFAQGAVMALEDAVVVADALALRPDDVPQALRSYQRIRRPRVVKVADASRNNGRIYHLGGASAVARNLVLRCAPPERLMARYDWLYGWKAGDQA